MQSVRLLPIALCVALCALAYDVVANPSNHQFGEYVVTVAPDSSATLSAADYQVTVQNAELLLARLTAPYQGRLSNSFVADLNRDGGFEVVVTYTSNAGEHTGIKVYTWKDSLLQPLAVSGLDTAQSTGYRGHDEVAVVEGQLIRMFQVYAEHNGEWEPTSERRRLAYSFEHGRWQQQ